MFNLLWHLHCIIGNDVAFILHEAYSVGFLYFYDIIHESYRVTID